MAASILHPEATPPTASAKVATVVPRTVAPDHLVPIVGLSTSETLVTGIVDPRSLTASYYYNFVAENTTNTEQEAQIKLLLPKSSTVSRGTLWINGVPQEAAFSETWRVSHAYDWITKMHRDPLLITQTAPGEVLIKASPVLPGQHMQFRIGITAAGRTVNKYARFELPTIEEANLTIAKPKIHLESSVPLATNDNAMKVRSAGAKLITSGTVSLSSPLIVDGFRGSLKEFATRATHSFGKAVIVANVDQATGTLSLQKSLERPNCIYVSSEDVAHRLSTLWAYSEVERLHELGQNQQAGDLANAYRIVSSVSGATVLERESDYVHSGLNREQYRSVAYVPSESTTSESFGVPKLQGAINSSIGPQGSVIIGGEPNLQGAINGTIGPQGSDAVVISGVNTAGTVRVNNLANLEAGLALVGNAAGPVGAGAINWLTASSRDANLFGGGDTTTDCTMSSPIALLLVPFSVVLIATNYIGPAAMFLHALRLSRTKRVGARRHLALGVAWLLMAVFIPLASQIALLSNIRLRRKAKTQTA
jgi:hypothetical protein